MRRAVLLAVCAAAAPAPTASAALPDACKLLTNAEVAKAFGAKVQTRTSERGGAGRSCTWAGAPAGSFTSAHATLHIDLGPVTRAQFLQAARNASGAVRLRGVGELAYAEYSGGEFLSAWQHGVRIGVALAGSPSPEAGARALARTALARLD